MQSIEIDKKEAAGSSWLESAIGIANVPTLACLLVQLTGDWRWIEGRFTPAKTRGLDDNEDGGLPVAVQEEIRAAALVAIHQWLGGKPAALRDPSDALLCRIMGVSLGDDIPIEYAPMIRQELRLQQEGHAPSLPVPPGFSALIVGAGISGLCAAMEFRRAGISYVILERNARPGGVWLENRYPGAACDVPSHLYSFSFAPYEWSRYFAGSREIQTYLEKLAVEQRILPNIRFGWNVVEARFVEEGGHWEVDAIADDGTAETLRANIIVSGVGAFNKPRLPDVPGLGSFRGPSVHTARYPDEGLDLEGRDVILIGNGASAMQVAPAIVDKVRSLTIVMRTPQWVAPFPKFGQSIPEDLRRLMREVEPYRLWYRLRLSWAFNDKQHASLQRDSRWTARRDSINAINDAHRRGLTAYMEQELGEAHYLLPSLLPDYPPFGKRMLLDNGWFRTLAKPQVTLVNGSVIEVGPNGVRTDDGVEHKADVLIWATGFDVVNLLAPMRVRGRGGRTLQEEWEGDNARAYLGTVVPGFPNFFCLYGPNTQFGHGGSLISVLERQMHYVMSLLEDMFARNIKEIDVKRDVYENYNRRVDEAHARMIWSLPELKGYYKNSRGRIVVNNPFRIIDVWKMTERANLDDFDCVTAA